MNTKRLIAITLTLFLTAQIAAIPIAYADEVSPGTVAAENSDGTLELIEAYPATADAPVLPATIQQGGKSYTLDNTTTSNDASYTKPRLAFTRTAFSEVPIEGINNLGAYFPATYPIDEGEYQGAIGLDPLTPFTVAERYEIFRVQVDRAMTFYGLPDNDVVRLPTSQIFTVSSSAYPGATKEESLQILDVSYTISGRDHLGMPNDYTAYVIYRGQEEVLQLHHYDVTAHYSGELVSSAEQMTVTGVYSPVPVVEPPTIEIPEIEVPLAAEPDTSFIPLAITAAAVVILLALPLLYLFFLTNARLLRVVTLTEKDQESEGVQKIRETTQIICRRRLTLREGEADFRIPPSVDIMNGDTFCIDIKPHIASQEGLLRLVWQGKLVAAMPLDEHIEINFQQMLIESVEAVLLQTDLLEEL